jgi:hypothetical protein
MTTWQREQIRLSLMRYCEAAQPYGLGAGLLLQFIRSEGFRAATAEQLAAELNYLGEKNFLAPVVKPLSPENRVWRITAAGRDFLAEQQPLES